MKVIFLCLIFFIMMLAPAWPLGAGLPTFHIEDPIIFITVLILLVRRGFGTLILAPDLRRLTIPHLFILLYLFILTMICFPLYPSSMELFSASIFASLSLFRPFFMLILIVGMGLNSKQVRRLAGFVIVLILLELWLIYCQEFDLFGVNYWLSPHYTIEELTAAYVAGRMSGSYGNPNDFGSAMSILVTFLFARVVIGPGFFTRIICGLAVGLSMICIVLFAKTRQGTLCSLGGCFVVQIYALFKSGRRSWAIFTLIAGIWAIIVGIGILATMPELADRFSIFTSGTSIMQEGSVQGRIPYLRDLILELGVFLMLGKGITDMLLRNVYDCGFFSILAIGGIPCFTAFMFMLLGPFISAKNRLLHNGLMHPDSWLHVGSLAAIVPIILINLPNATLNNAKVFSTIMIVYGLSFAAMRAQDTEEEFLDNDYEQGEIYNEYA